LKIQIEDASPNLNPWTDQYLASIILKMKSLSKYISKVNQIAYNSIGSNESDS
jgi:hypothetical protein